MNKQVTIVTIPLACYHAILYWCLYNQYTGKIREDLLNRPTGGKQIPFAFEQALRAEGDILIFVDDKFHFERDKHGNIPTEVEVKEFTEKYALPQAWLDTLTKDGMMSRIVVPPSHLACTPYSFSEKMILAHSNGEHGLPGECANEWTVLLEYLQGQGYEAIHAYIPRACAKGICYATPYAQEAGIWTKPISIGFTDKDNVSFEYKDSAVAK